MQNWNPFSVHSYSAQVPFHIYIEKKSEWVHIQHGMWHGTLELVLIKIHRILKQGNAFLSSYHSMILIIY